LKRDGTITGVRIEVVDDFGAFSEWLSAGQIVKPITTFSGCYKIPNYDYDCKIALTNKVPQGPYRGFGLPSHYWVLEHLIDKAAAQLGLDRAELRRRNFVPTDEFPYTLPSGNVYDSGNYTGSLDVLLAGVEYERLKEEQARARADGRLVGMSVVTSLEPGLTTTPMLGLLSPRMFSRTSSPEGVLVRLDAFAKIIAEVGFPWGGQSQHTFVRQFLADYFGVSDTDVQVITVDSLSMQPGFGPISSRLAVALGGALAGAAARLAEKLACVAAVMLEVAPEDVELFDGQLRVRGAPDRAVPLLQVVMFMTSRPDRLPAGVDGNPEATYVWNPPANHQLADEQGRAHYSITASGAVHLCMVEIDRDTGKVDILKYAVVDDCGVRMNPSVVRGMIHGGLAQGIGCALLEEFVYDDTGQLLTSTYMDYLMPSIMEMPDLIEDFETTRSPRSGSR
jgi:3-oxo-Delta1-steroid hydratase/dehydrogenase large subunit